MMLALKMALRSIGSNKLRAVLTMLGIIIGVMALVVLVSLVNSATGSVTDAVESLGSDYISVTVSDDKGYPIRLSDLEQWTEELEAVEYIAAYASESVTGKYKGENDSFTLYGVSPMYYEIQGLQLDMGRFIKNTDLDNASRVCVLNYAAATELIGFADCVGEEISLNGMKYTVVGVLGEDENIASAFSGGSLIAYVPYTSLLRLSSELNMDIESFCLNSGEDFTVEQAEDEISALLYERFEEDEDAYSISGMDVMEDAMSSITSVLSILLGGIAGISLIVGGIGIMNIMLVTVTERTREIGIRKAIGASRAVILRQFLLEAVVLCMMGCAIGIFLSWSILRMVSVVVSSLSMSFELDLAVVLIAVGFCFVIGLVFGLYPANKAARMKPIDALHYGG